MSDYNYLAKIIIIGDSSVGKSCLLFRMADRQWCSDTDPTIGVEFRSMTVEANKYIFKLQLWDTSGQERFKSIVRSYYTQGTGCLLVFDITNHESFTHLNDWYDDLKNKSTICDSCILLVGTKSDLNKQRVIDKEQAIHFAKERGLLGYIETSSKNGTGMDSITDMMVKSFEKLIDCGKLELPRNTMNLIEMDVEPHKSLAGCCLCQ